MKLITVKNVTLAVIEDVCYVWHTLRNVIVLATTQRWMKKKTNGWHVSWGGIIPVKCDWL